MERVVMKFGGSSVATIDKIKQVAQLVVQRKQEVKDLVVVVSAMGKSTNHLIELAGELSNEPSECEMDLLMATGEMVSSALLAIYLNAIGSKACSLTGFQVGLKTSGAHMQGKIENVGSEKLDQCLAEGTIAVVTGFQGIDEAGEITTLGRGGSDTSAVALAAVLNARCEIYTDVAGIYTADPRIRQQAYKLDHVTYEETMEMANLGAKVLEPRSVEMANRYHVPLYVALNTGDIIGTQILSEDERMEKTTLTNVSKIDEVLLVNLKAGDNKDLNITECFLRLAHAHINIDIISHTVDHEGNRLTSFTSTTGSKTKIERILKELAADYTFTEDVSKVSIIGSAMRNQTGIAARAFDVFYAQDIPFYSVSTSEISISYVVDTAASNQIVNALADEFGL